MYLLFNIPAIVIMLVAAIYITEIIHPSPANGALDPETLTYLYTQLGLPLAFILMAIPGDKGGACPGRNDLSDALFFL